MHPKRASGFVLLVAAALTITACGPIRLDGRPQIRGRVVSVDTGSVSIRHKTGKTYRVELTPGTTVVDTQRREDTGLCAGRRATAYLVDTGRFTASSITVWGGRCQ